MDLLAVIPAEFLDSGTPEQQALIDWLIASEDDPKRSFACDIDVYLRYPENSPNYHLWESAFSQKQRLFGFSVATQQPKGIIVVDLAEVFQ